MIESAEPVCAYGFMQRDLHRIEAFVESENTACMRSLEKLGFVHEGTMRDCEIKDGRFISLEVYARLHLSS